MSILRPSILSGLRYAIIAVSLLPGSAAAAAIQYPAPVNFTDDQDRQNMMGQLGITALRPGASGNDKSPNHANYDPAKANPYPVLPEPLTMKDGRKVVTAELWKARRGELLEDFSREVYGRVPRSAPPVRWRVIAVDRERLGFTPVIAKRLVGHVDNAAYPGIAVDIAMTVVLPAEAKGPVPLLMMFGRSGFPAPGEPAQEDFDRLNAAMKALLAKHDPALKNVFERYQAFDVLRPTPMQRLPLNEDGDPASIQQLVADGWGYAVLDPVSVQADNGAGLTRGIIGLVNKGQPRKPEDWGALRAWAWGASRGFDYLATDPAIDARHIGIEGVSRYGKAALVTMAYDERFAMGLIGSSGKGGATPMRRSWGEDLSNLATGEYYWMAGNFLKYDASAATFGSKTANDLPVDANELLALCAPRLTFVSYGIPEKGDARWLDHQGSFMAVVSAGATFRLLGAKDLGAGDDYQTAQMPPVNTGLLDGALAWRQHDGGHTDAPNMKYFLQWADKKIGHTPPLE